jgi:hypothetical protein
MKRLAALLLVSLLSACASRPTAPPQPITSLALMSVYTPDRLRRPLPPVEPDKAATETPAPLPPVVPSITYLPHLIYSPSYIYIPRAHYHSRTNHNRVNFRHGHYGAIGAGAIGGAVAGLLFLADLKRAEGQQRAENLLYQINLDPTALLSDKLNSRLGNLKIPLEPVADSEAVMASRIAGEWQKINNKASHLLDIQLTEFGYSYALIGGYNPMLGVTVTLYDSQTGYWVDSYSYWSDHRSRNDPRWFTTPANMSFDAIDNSPQTAAAVRAGFEAAMGKIADRIVQDLTQRVAGLPIQ